MEVTFDDEFLPQVLEAESAARGLDARLKGLVVARENDGLDEQEAFLDAADSLGLTAEIRDALASAVEPLAEAEVEVVSFQGAHGGMPTLRRTEHQAWIALEPATLDGLISVVTPLVSRLLEDVEKTAVTLPIGLGGSGGCACGDELPEDAPPGPLFVRSEPAGEGSKVWVTMHLTKVT